MLKRLQIHILISTLVFVTWISAQEFNEKRSFLDGFDSNGTHWQNCTIDGKPYYDEDCLGWFARILTLLGMGIVLLIILMCGCFWYCLCTLCRIICCTDQPREYIYTTYVYPPAYIQIP